MPAFKLHTVESAPATSVAILDGANKALGFIPNLYAHLAESPAALQAYRQLGALLETSGLKPEEQQVVLLACSVQNRCAYCVAAHSFIARNMTGIDGDIIAALRNGGALPDAGLDALAGIARAVVRERGWVNNSPELRAFYAAGYTPRHALDVLLGVAMKVLSNYTNHLTATPIDAAFAGEAWEMRSDYA
ncbi:MAG: carboxymuconolactone decarboxylase family protein [Gammaproteobacteria bacterium]|nr:carboxymuconolactone decarboxylase family protein [Gammaproteobacteria bacterium]